MLNFIRRRLDEVLTGLFLILVLLLILFCSAHYATPGGRSFTQWTFSIVVLLFALLLVAARFTPLVRPLLRVVLEIGPMLVAVLGYVSLKLYDASTITAWLGIPSLDRYMMAADVALFGKTPYLWFSQWGLDSPAFVQVMSSFYGLYPFTPLIALAWFYYKGDMQQLRLIRRALFISLYCGYCCYILLPVSGPLTLIPQAAPLLIQSTTTYAFLMDNYRFATDCFPSLHTANPWLIVFLCRGKLPRWLMAAAIAVCTCITLSTFALRFHYGIDDLAGLAWASLMAFIAPRTLPREAAE